MANNPITSDSLTINFGDLMRVPISLRADAAANYPSMLSVLTPIQIAKAFPDYYKKQLPDVSNFVTANIEKKVAGGFSGYDSGGGGGGGGGGGWGDESTPKLSVDDMKKKLLEKGIDVEGISSAIPDTGILSNSPQAKIFKNASKAELDKMGFERFEDPETGKSYIKTKPIEEESMTDEQIVERLRKRGSNIDLSGAESKDRYKASMQFFMNKGWTKEQAAGIVGNLMVESGNFSDDVIKGERRGDKGKAFGVAQWHPDRQNLFSKQFGKSITESTLQEQLEFVDWELNNSEKKAGDILRKTASAAEAAEAVDIFYERSAGIHRRERMDNANRIVQEDITKPIDPNKVFTPEEIKKAREEEIAAAKKLRTEEKIKYAYGQSSSSSSVSPEKSREYLSEVAQRAQALTPEQEVERPSHMEGFVEFQGLDVKFKAGSGGRSEEFPSTPYGVYKLPGMSAPGDKLRGKFAAMRGEGNTEIINIPNRYDPALGRTRTEMQFHPAIAPRDIDGDDIKDLISQGCIAIDPSQYDEFMATYKKFYEENNGNVWLSVLPGPPGEPARFSITNKEPVASEIITTDQALSNFESTGVVSPETYSQAVAQMSDADKTEAFGSSTKAETSTEAVNKAVQDIGGPAALDAAEQSIVIPNQINPNLPGGEEAMAGKEDLKGVVFHKTPLSLDDLQAGKDPRDSTYGYNTAIISTYVDAKGNKITEAQWKKLSKDDKLMYTEKAEVHQIRPEDVRPNQIRKTSDPDSPRSEEIGTELNNVNALGVVTIGSDSAAKQEAAQNYLAELLAKGKISEDALGSVYGHGEIQIDKERPFMDPGKSPEGSVMAESVRSNIDAIKKKAEELKKQNATSIEAVPAQEQPVNIEKQAAEDVGSIFGPDGAIFNPVIEGSESTDDQEVKKFRTGGSPYTQDDEDLSVIDREGNLRWQMNSGEGVYVKPSSDEYADNKMQELSGQIDQITENMQKVDNNTQQPNRKQSSIDSSANMRRAIENLSKVPETKKTNSISEARVPAGTQHRAFSMSHFRPVQSRRLGERGSPNIP